MLALQGDFREHLAVLTELGAVAIPVRREQELDQVDGLVLPGGESTVIDKLARNFGLAEPLKAKLAGGLPAYGTCAGLILLADRVVDAGPGQQSFGGLDVSVRRNAFGGQVDSFETDVLVDGFEGPPVHAAFIRAPVVDSVGPAATPIAHLTDGRVVAVRQGALLGTSFHPEITGELRFHRAFLDTVAARL